MWMGWMIPHVRWAKSGEFECLQILAVTPQRGRDLKITQDLVY